MRTVARTFSVAYPLFRFAMILVALRTSSLPTSSPAGQPAAAPKTGHRYQRIVNPIRAASSTNPYSKRILKQIDISAHRGHPRIAACRTDLFQSCWRSCSGKFSSSAIFGTRIPIHHYYCEMTAAIELEYCLKLRLIQTATGRCIASKAAPRGGSNDGGGTDPSTHTSYSTTGGTPYVRT